MVVARSNICTEFDDRTVGTKVEDVYEFTRALHEVVPQHDWSDSENGQEVITLDDHFLYPVQEVVSAGVGRTTDDPDDYVIRQYRGTPKKYLKRRCAAEAESCRAVVYTQLDTVLISGKIFLLIKTSLILRRVFSWGFGVRIKSRKTWK